jgi:hypothetical protein
MNQTPLMAAAAAGNIALVDASLERGASRSAAGHYGWSALHWVLREALLRRIDQGWYQFNPQLLVRRDAREGDGEAWQPIFGALNLALTGDFVRMDAYRPLQALAQAAGVAVAELPLLKAERILQAREALQAQQEAMRQREAERQALAAVSQHTAAGRAGPAPWGTPQARAQEIERIRAEIAARQAAGVAEKKEWSAATGRAALPVIRTADRAPTRRDGGA